MEVFQYVVGLATGLFVSLVGQFVGHWLSSGRLTRQLLQSRRTQLQYQDRSELRRSVAEMGALVAEILRVSSDLAAMHVGGEPASLSSGMAYVEAASKAWSMRHAMMNRFGEIELFLGAEHELAQSAFAVVGESGRLVQVAEAGDLQGASEQGIRLTGAMQTLREVARRHLELAAGFTDALAAASSRTASQPRTSVRKLLDKPSLRGDLDA